MWGSRRNKRAQARECANGPLPGRRKYQFVCQPRENSILEDTVTIVVKYFVCRLLRCNARIADSSLSTREGTSRQTAHMCDDDADGETIYGSIAFDSRGARHGIQGHICHLSRFTSIPKPKCIGNQSVMSCKPRQSTTPEPDISDLADCNRIRNMDGVLATLKASL